MNILKDLKLLRAKVRLFFSDTYPGITIQTLICILGGSYLYQIIIILLAVYNIFFNSIRLKLKLIS